MERSRIFDYQVLSGLKTWKTIKIKTTSPDILNPEHETTHLPFAGTIPQTSDLTHTRVIKPDFSRKNKYEG